LTTSPVSAVERRAETLDTIAAVLPMNRRDRLAGILTDEDVETLRHLVNEGMGENTLRALTSDLAYLEAWSMAATGNLPGTGSPVAEICLSSSVAAAATRDRPGARHASRRGRGIAPTRFSARVGTACSRKSANAITGDILGKLLATCSGGDLTALRDRAILMVAFASGGRRRSEVAGLRVEQLVKQAPVTDVDGSPLPAFISVAPKPVAPITMKSSI